MSNNTLCRPCFKLDKTELKMISNNKEIKSEFRVDKLLTKLKVLEGIVKAELLLSDELKWQQAYDKYGLFGSHPPALENSTPQSLLE